MKSITSLRSIPELLAVPTNAVDLDWLAECLQVAIQIEMFTLPPYLCARWSISDDGGTATSRMRTIARDEMNHLGWVANIMAGIGYAPQIRDTPARTVVPDYRNYENPPGGQLPGGVHADVLVTLGALTEDQLKLFMTIEEPEVPLPKAAERVTIGMFYERLMDELRGLDPRFDPTRQLSEAGKVFANTDEALEALDQIGKEGEGTNDSPYYRDALTHHYVFGEILYRKAFIEHQPGKWWYLGDPVAFPRSVRALRGPAPVGDSDNLAFNGVYSEMLSLLHDAWNGGGSSAFWSSVGAMGRMQAAAETVMNTGYWPTFEYTQR